MTPRMKNVLSKKQIQRYLHSNGTHCPFCDIADLALGENMIFDGATITQDMVCMACKETWTDFYKLRTAEALRPIKVKGRKFTFQLRSTATTENSSFTWNGWKSFAS